jgi:hypothetical protein
MSKTIIICRTRAGGYPGNWLCDWVPAYAGMTKMVGIANYQNHISRSLEAALALVKPIHSVILIKRLGH